MKSHKTILKITYGVIGLSVVAVIALFVYQQQQIRKMDKAGSSGILENKPSEMVPENAAAVKIPPRDLDTDINEPSRHPGTPEAPAPDPDGRTELKKDTATWDNPYDVLFRELALPPEKQHTLKALFLDLQTRKSDLNMELLDTSIPDEKREEILQRIVMLKNEVNEKVLEILGTENYGTYLIYEQKLRERTLLTAFVKSLGPGEKLTGLREQAFIDAMYEERKKIKTAPPEDSEIQTPTDLDAQISRVLETTDQTYSGYIKAAGMYLSPARMEQFKNYLDRRRDTMAMSLNAMRQVFGDDSVPSQAMKKPNGTSN